jgi:hypothetical protein
MNFSSFGNFDINEKWDEDQILKKLNFSKTDHNNINFSPHRGIFISQSNSNFLNPKVSA